MIFQKKALSTKNKYLFKLGPNTLDHTTNYTYLGLVINASGSFTTGLHALRDKARSVFYTVYRTINKYQPPIKTWLKIIDAIITPILLYGSEIWGPSLLLSKKKNGTRLN